VLTWSKFGEQKFAVVEFVLDLHFVCAIQGHFQALYPCPVLDQYGKLPGIPPVSLQSSLMFGPAVAAETFALCCLTFCSFHVLGSLLCPLLLEKL
jgi:hypothetical protein